MDVRRENIRREKEMRYVYSEQKVKAVWRNKRYSRQTSRRRGTGNDAERH